MDLACWFSLRGEGRFEGVDYVWHWICEPQIFRYATKLKSMWTTWPMMWRDKAIYIEADGPSIVWEAPSSISSLKTTIERGIGISMRWGGQFEMGYDAPADEKSTHKGYNIPPPSLDATIISFHDSVAMLRGRMSSDDFPLYPKSSLTLMYGFLQLCIVEAAHPIAVKESKRIWKLES